MRPAKKKTAVIVQDPEHELPAEVIAQAVIDLSRAAQRLLNGRLKREAIIALIHDHSKVNKGTIGIVLTNLELLEQTWTRKVPR